MISPGYGFAGIDARNEFNSLYSICKLRYGNARLAVNKNMEQKTAGEDLISQSNIKVNRFERSEKDIDFLAVYAPNGDVRYYRPNAVL